MGFKDRMKEISDNFAVPNASKVLRDDPNVFSRQNRSERKKNEKISKEIVTKIHKLRSSQMSSGAGLLIDQKIRGFYWEYMERLLSTGTGTMPSSFNVMEAFLQFKHYRHPKNTTYKYPYITLRPEKDHLFSIDDFFGFVTDPSSDIDLDTGLHDDLPQNKIYSFTPVGDIGDFSFTYSNGREYVVSGFSFIRLEDEVSWLLVGGPVITDDIRNEIDTHLSTEEKGFIYDKGLDLSKLPKREPIYLNNDNSVWSNLFLGKFDLETKQNSIRMVFNEFTDSYRGIIDDPHQPITRTPENLKQLDEMSVIFNLTETFLFLPSYFNFKIHLVVEKPVNSTDSTPNYFKENSSKPLNKNTSTKKSRLKIKRVTSIEFLNNKTPVIIRTFSPPRYQVEVLGYYRKLKNSDSLGKDENGNIILGKTWIKPHNRWKNNPLEERPPTDEKIIFLKSSVHLAKEQEKILSKGESQNSLGTENNTDQQNNDFSLETCNESNTGSIYVMRNILSYSHFWCMS